MANILVVDGDQLARLMKLCRTIIAGGGGTVDQLTAKLKKSRRTIFRDMNSLNDLGIKITLTPKGYQIKQNAAACKKALAEHQNKSFNKLISSALK